MDLVTYVKDLDAFRNEARIISESTTHPLHSHFTVDEGNEVKFMVANTPIKYKDDGSICVIDGLAIDHALLDSMETLEYLGHVVSDTEIDFVSAEAKGTYESVLGDRTKTFTDSEGVTHTYEAPYIIGMFAR